MSHAASSSEPDNLRRLARIAAALPEADRVDVPGWDGEPTFRVRGKVFLFASPSGTSIYVKLPHPEAEALVAGDDAVTPMRYGLGRHGWIQARLPTDADAERWQEIAEWIRTSYTLVAPKKLARLLDQAPGSTPPG
ncbi:MAG TPA: MmcQ/YjbR family DNA-binding protein [Micromonosporaceae bacterium]